MYRYKSMQCCYGCSKDKTNFRGLYAWFTMTKEQWIWDWLLSIQKCVCSKVGRKSKSASVACLHRKWNYRIFNTDYYRHGFLCQWLVQSTDLCIAVFRSVCSDLSVSSVCIPILRVTVQCFHIHCLYAPCDFMPFICPQYMHLLWNSGYNMGRKEAEEGEECGMREWELGNGGGEMGS